MDNGFLDAFRMLARFDPDLVEIILLSIKVSFSAVAVALLLALPFGALLATWPFPGRRALVVLVNALMGLPPVVVGLGLYLLFSHRGALGVLEFLYTPTAMIVAQTVLVFPIAASLSRQVFVDLHAQYDEMLRSLGANKWQILLTVFWEARRSLLTVALAGMGRALSEVGAVMIVGGNIDHVTRVMTTAIALETSKGSLAFAMALGIVLLALSVIVNAAVSFLRTDNGGAVHV